MIGIVFVAVVLVATVMLVVNVLPQLVFKTFEVAFLAFLSELEMVDLDVTPDRSFVAKLLLALVALERLQERGRLQDVAL